VNFCKDILFGHLAIKWIIMQITNTQGEFSAFKTHDWQINVLLHFSLK